ncbi:MAG: hypothetical protein M5R40_12845 [Anaerolineae bacterium]|nr:hypothetical protein [Anaerolineae bacterium]
MKQKDARVTAQRPLTAYCYGIVDADGHSPATQWETLHYLHELGFLTARDVIRRFDSLDELIGYLQAFEVRRHSLPYEMDGLVIKVDDLATYRDLGVVGRARAARWLTSSRRKRRPPACWT